MKNIFNTITSLLFLFIGTAAIGQEAMYLEEEISLNSQNKYLLLIRNNNQQVIYTGVFDTHHNLPTGSHYYFDKKGKIKRLIEYSFNGKKFEGVPEVVQKTYFFGKNQKIEKVIQAERCNECEYSPTGIWEFYKNGKLIKTIDTNKKTNLKHENFEIYWDLLKKSKTKQQATKTPLPIFTTISDFTLDKIEQVKIFKLNRTSLENYEKTGKYYELSRAEIEELLHLLKGSTNFYGGTPLMFAFSSEIIFYAKGKQNNIKIAPEAKKVLQEGFKIPHNKAQTSETTGAVYWPFINDEFAQFLKRLEAKF